jgi:hypothetical protein
MESLAGTRPTLHEDRPWENADKPGVRLGFLSSSLSSTGGIAAEDRGGLSQGWNAKECVGALDLPICCSAL